MEVRIEEMEDVLVDRNRLEVDNIQLKMELKKFQDNLKEVVEKYEGEWQHTKQSEFEKEILRNEQLMENCRRLEIQLEKCKEKLEESQR